MNTDTPTFPNLESLFNGDQETSLVPSLIDTDAIISSLMPVIISMVVISGLFALLYLVSIIQRIRVDRATLESRNILREMNERDKARSTPSTQDSDASRKITK